jgi:DHA2 family metal-tetracycline-proton antiporter-like MFS transporter
MFEYLRNNQQLSLLIISLGAFMGFLDMSIVNVSLSTMAIFFHVGTSTVFWVILIYVIVLGSFVIAFGKLAQQKGYKKIFLTGFLVFIIGSALSGLAQQFDLLIIARFIQAAGAAMFSAITAAMVAIAIFNPPNPKFIVGESPLEFKGIASGLVTTARMMGNGFGTAILASAAIASIFLHGEPNTTLSITPVSFSAGLHTASYWGR